MVLDCPHRGCSIVCPDLPRHITNADMKLVSVIYDKLMAYHDSVEKEEKL